MAWLSSAGCLGLRYGFDVGLGLPCLYTSQSTSLTDRPSFPLQILIKGPEPCLKAESQFNPGDTDRPLSMDGVKRCYLSSLGEGEEAGVSGHPFPVLTGYFLVLFSSS